MQVNLDRLERLTSDQKLPVVPALEDVRNQLVDRLIQHRDDQEKSRLQGAIEIIDILVENIEAPKK